ncbi:MAG: protein translocase subunit SecD [Planctomycetes bacterium]|nr:protein translocase subunit SecD [Planctomycetota bacterium]
MADFEWREGRKDYMLMGLRWRTIIIIVTIAASLWAVCPPSDNIIKREKVKEVGGEVVQQEVLEQSWLRFFPGERTVRETILKEETKDDGTKTREKIIEHIAKGRIKLGLDLKGGSELLYRVRVASGEDRPGITGEIIDVLEKRIDPQGVKEYRIQEQGSHRILIQVPGATKEEIERMKQRLVSLGKLEFRLCATRDSIEYQDALKDKQVPGYYKHWIGKKSGVVDESGNWELVRNKVEITGEHLSRVYSTRDSRGLYPAVGFEFDAVGKNQFGHLTERNIGKPLAIILDNVLYTAPIIKSRIPGVGIVEGNFTQEKVNDLLAVLRAGSLPADLELEMETTVGPSLGSDSIRKGLLAGWVGSTFVVLFIGIYYLGVGWVANFALLLNIFFIFGAMALINATLTLPGIAGLVLTIGMAVDANVLIFERIREEKGKGKPIKLAVKAGYERAFTTIFDSNLTTLITGVILAAVGTGPVKGFAWVLILGLIINMFTAIFVTRTIYEYTIDREWTKSFSMLLFLKEPAAQFTHYRRFFIPLSCTLIIAGMVAFAIRGKDKYDIDFTGGTLVHLQLNRPTPAGFVRTAMADVGYDHAEVQGIWSTESLVQAATDASEFGIRIKELTNEQVKDKFLSDFKRILERERQYGEARFADKTSIELKLNTPVEEAVLSKYLTDAGYGDEDIVSIIPVGSSTKFYEFVIPGIADEKVRHNILTKITDGLKDHIASYQVELSFGDIKETLPTSEAAPKERQYVSHSSLDLDLNRAIDPTLLRLEFAKAGFGDVTIETRETETRRALTTRFQIGGTGDALQSIKQKMAKTLTIPSISNIGSNSIHVELKEPIEEVALIGLLKNRHLDGIVSHNVALNLPSETYVVNVNPLRTGKIQEKIQEDIAKIFKDNLYSETVTVNIVPANENATHNVASTSEVKEVHNNPVEKSTELVFKIELNPPMQKERIEHALSQAGYLNMLLEELKEDTLYQTLKINVNPSEVEKMKDDITKALTAPQPLKRVVSIGSTVAGEMKNRAIVAIIFSWLAIIIYVWIRFGQLKFGVAAVIALIHDVLITAGAVAIADHYSNIFGDVKINLSMVAAFLTLVGYSINDTIVIFDRIRENMGGKQANLTPALINTSINQTLSRTILTSSTVLGVVLALYLLGGSVIHGFAFVMVVGTITGSYSTIFIAAPILEWWRKK